MNIKKSVPVHYFPKAYITYYVVSQIKKFTFFTVYNYH